MEQFDAVLIIDEKQNIVSSSSSGSIRISLERTGAEL